MFFPVNVEIPVDLSKAGSVAEAEFEIFLKDKYELYLDFLPIANNKFSDEEIEHLLQFVGAWRHAPGQIIPIKIVIIKLDDQKKEIVVNKKYSTAGMRGVNSSSICRDLTVLHLDPGKYKIKIENDEGFPELSSVRTLLIICYFRAK